MHTPFIPQLTTTDWNKEWQTLQALRRRADNARWWDERAKTFTTKDAPRTYVNDFLKLAHITPGNNVFDMGCGTGALAIPLAKIGCTVTAADFSQGMLDVLTENQTQHGVTGITPLCMSWEDNWDEHGVTAKSADVCIASRSIAVHDLKESLLRLSVVARKRVCITLATSASPRTDETLLRALGLTPPQMRDYQYALNILINEGMQPTLHYIHSTRNDTYADKQDAYAHLSTMLAYLSMQSENTYAHNAALRKLSAWIDDNLVENEYAGTPDNKGIPQKPWRLRIPRKVTWAFISWDV